MKLIRSFPREIPTGNPGGCNHVIDDAERMVNWNYDYSGLLAYQDDIVQIDWDTAVSREDLVIFAERAKLTPESVLVAPMPIYPDNRPGLTKPHWNCCRRINPVTPDLLREVDRNDSECDLFGFGMIYLPLKMIQGFALTTRFFSDRGFAEWHNNQHGSAKLIWDIHPIHLHYQISQVSL